MMVNINYLAVVVSALASMVVGFLWYGPLFGKKWMALSGKSEGKIAESKAKGMWKLYIISFIGTLLMAYALDYSLIFASAYLNTGGFSAGLMAGFWTWLGFIAPVTVGSVLWEGKSWKLWFLKNCHQLISLLVMGVILSIWQ